MTPPTHATSSANHGVGPLERVEARLLPSRLAHGLRLHNLELGGERLLPVVRLCADGVHGFGEAPPLLTFTGETAEATVAGVRRAARLLEGRTPDEALACLHAPGSGLGPSTRAALDIALHDLLARRRGLPLHRILAASAGRASRPSPVRVSRAIGFHSLERTVALARGYRRAGVTALKLKIGRAPSLDVGVVEAVRRAVGADVELAVDANGAYDADTALCVWRRLRGLSLVYLEQPVARHDLAGLRRLRAAGAVVLVDESVFDLADLARVAAAGAADGIVVKLIKCGGLRPALGLARASAERGLQVVVVDPLGSAVSLNAGLHLAAALPPTPFAHGLSAGLEVSAPYAPHLPVVGGRLAPPTAPGLGVEVVWPEGGVA